MKKIIITHVGAWNTKEEDVQNTEKILAENAAIEGMKEENTEEMTVKAVSFLENAPELDAGTGSILQIDGCCRMDSAIADSERGYAGILQIENIKNPALVAKRLLQYGYHSILSGKGAQAFALEEGLELANVITESRWQQYTEKRKLIPDPLYRNLATNQKALNEKKLGTVGAVALADGRLTAVSSTGGLAFGYPGRVGDTAIFGAGIFCNKDVAVTCTGEGDKILQMMLALKVWLYYKENQNLQLSTQKAIEELYKDYNAQSGVIALSRRGETAVAFSTSFLATKILEQ